MVAEECAPEHDGKVGQSSGCGRSEIHFSAPNGVLKEEDDCHHEPECTDEEFEVVEEKSANPVDQNVEDHDEGDEPPGRCMDGVADRKGYAEKKGTENATHPHGRIDAGDSTFQVIEEGALGAKEQAISRAEEKECETNGAASPEHFVRPVELVEMRIQDAQDGKRLQIFKRTVFHRAEL